MDTLAFDYILPTTGRIPDLHRLETCAAGRTTKKDTFCKVMQNVSFYNRLLSFSKIINRHFIAKTESLVRRGFPFQHAAALLINNLL